jgi:hypothetical protein
MKAKAFRLLGVAAVIFLIGCKSNPVSFEGGAPGASPDGLKMAEAALPPERQVTEDAMAPGAPGSLSEVVVTRKIIRDGRMEVRVRDLEQGKKMADSLVHSYNGYYADETYNNMDYSHGYAMKIRIPADNFDSFIAAIESGAGEVVFKNITSRDVTEEFIDLETRLKNKNNYLNRYADLLKQAKSVKDILEIEEKTRLIEEEVESVQGRLKYLGNQVHFSTLDLQISKKNDYSIYSDNKGSFFDRLKLSLVKGWFGLVSFTLFVIRIWPFWIIVGTIFYFIRRILRKRKNRQ